MLSYWTKSVYHVSIRHSQVWSMYQMLVLYPGLVTNESVE